MTCCDVVMLPTLIKYPYIGTCFLPCGEYLSNFTGNEKSSALFLGVTFVSKSDSFVDFPVDVDSNDFEDDGVFISAESLGFEVDGGFFRVASLDFEDGVLFCADILI